MRLAALLLLAGCASPMPARLDWSALPDLTPPQLAQPEGVAVAVVAGDAVDGDGYVVPPVLYLTLESRAGALDLALDALAAERAGREADRAWASAVYSEAVAACRRRQRVACAVCAAMSSVVSAGTVGGATAGACR